MTPTEPPPPLPLPPPLPQPKPYPGFWQAVGLLALFLAGTALVVAPFAIVDQIAKTTWMKSLWVLGLATLGGAALAAWFAESKLKLGVKELAGPVRVPAELIGPVGTVIAGQLLLTLLVLLATLRLFPSLLPANNLNLDHNLLGASFALLVAAPLAEELLFRGIFLRGFIPRYGAMKGILLGAALFAMMHLSPAKFFGTFALGVIFGWWYSKLGHIWLGVLGHALNNAVPLVLALASRGAKGASAGKDLHAVPPFSAAEPVLALVGVAMLAHGLLAMGRYFRMVSSDHEGHEPPIGSA